MKKRAVPTPWIPGIKTSHVLMEHPEKFVAGTAHIGTNPYPDFHYTSPALQAGVVRQADVMQMQCKVEQEPPTEQVGRVKALFRKVFKPMPWSTQLRSTCSFLGLPPTPDLASASSDSMASVIPRSINITGSNSPSVRPVTNGTGLRFKVKLWARNIWIPRARRISNSSPRLDLLA